MDFCDDHLSQHPDTRETGDSNVLFIPHHEREASRYLLRVRSSKTAYAILNRRLCALQKDLGHNEFSPLGTSEPGLQAVSNVQQVDGGVAVLKNLSSLRMIVLSFVTSVSGLGTATFIWFVFVFFVFLYHLEILAISLFVHKDLSGFT